MTGTDATNESQANVLCKSCGLCCTGHLFLQTKLRSAELDSAEALGLNVFRTPPSQRGFSQPCPLWQGQCTIYTSAHYPRFCSTYKCKLLKEVLDEATPLNEALIAVEQAKEMIGELEALLPDSPGSSFRERLVAYLEDQEGQDASAEQENKSLDLLQQKADALLISYEKVFGVNDFVDIVEERWGNR